MPGGVSRAAVAVPQPASASTTDSTSAGRLDSINQRFDPFASHDLRFFHSSISLLFSMRSSASSNRIINSPSFAWVRRSLRSSGPTWRLSPWVPASRNARFQPSSSWAGTWLSRLLGVCWGSVCHWSGVIGQGSQGQGSCLANCQGSLSGVRSCNHPFLFSASLKGRRPVAWLTAPEHARRSGHGMIVLCPIVV